ncbi:MAG: ArsR/SmtB family transcription factor [Clostridium sp.]|uniref:ArsR/SmtB family transcription factor n=1 Tax=Clostridium sp. TaxID=1506 RepID=UPI003D6C90BA
MEESKILSTIEQVKAISDPYKFRILKTFKAINEPATVKQVADYLNEVPAKVYYHVKKMEKLGILQLIFTKEINGIIAKYYEPTASHFEVKCDANIDDAYKAVMLGETQIMIAEIYNNSKNIFLEDVSFSEKNDKKPEGKLTMADLYLTEQQSKEFSKYVEDFILEHGIKDKNATDENKYHCFMSFIKLRDDSNIKPK